MSPILKQRLQELEKKAIIPNREHMEQALLAIMEYEQRMNLKEQNISLIEECVDVINKLSGIHKERELAKARKAGNRIIDRIHNSDLSTMSEVELREVLRFETDKDELEDIPDDKYLDALLSELHGNSDEKVEYFFGLKQRYEAGSLDISELAEEDIFGLLHSEAVRIAQDEPANIRLIVELLKKRELRKGFDIPEEYIKMFEKAFIEISIPYKKGSVEGKVIRKLMRTRRSRLTKGQKRRLNDIICQSVVEIGEEYSWFAKFKLKRCRLFKAAQIAIVTLVVLAVVQITSLAFFEHDFFGNVWNWTKEMVTSLIGEKMEKDNAVSTSSLSKVYKTLDEFITAENIEIIVPQYIPNNTKLIEIVYMSDPTQNEKTFVAKYTNDVFLFVYLNNNLIPVDYEEITEIYLNNEKEYYIYKDITKVEWLDNQNTYNLTGNFTLEEFKQIINSLHE